MTADLVKRLRGWLDEDVPIGVIMNEAADRIEQLEADQRDTTEEFGKLSHDLGKALLEATRLREANELMLTDIRRTDVDMLAFKARIEQLEAALRWIDEQRYVDRSTINQDNAFRKAVSLNERLVKIMGTARAALEERT